MDDPKKHPDATVLRPRGDVPGNRTRAKNNQADKSAQRSDSWTSLDTGKAQALTAIGESIKSINNSTGFEKARVAANRALADNKIILNKRFVLDTIIGGGGMGTVYKARDLRKVEANDANPYIAVKVLNEGFVQHPDAFVTLQREASRSQILAHPNIALVYDFDRDGSVIYMTMQYLQGMDLEQYIMRQGSRGCPIDKALTIIKQYCAALAYAHEKKIVHSDLKPGNIFVSKSGVKVLDFGIARFTADAQNADHFDAGKLGALTPAYASLEMLQGDSPDPGDDVYAAAIIAYELISGQHPYQRLSAEEALQKGIKPKRIPGLNKRQWQALDNALKIKRSARTPTVAQFLQQLIPSKKSRIVKYAAAAIVLAAVGVAYMGYYSHTQLKHVIARTLNKGQECYRNQDYACSKDSAEAVLHLDANNLEAKKLSESSARAMQNAQMQKSYQAALKCINAGNLDCARANTITIKQIDGKSPLIATLQTGIKIKTAQIAANSCMSDHDYACVIKNTDIIKSLDQNNQDADQLESLARQKMEAEQKTAAGKVRSYKNNMRKAKSCYKNADYACAEKHAKLAMLYRPGDSVAQSMIDKSNLASSQHKEAKIKAEKLYAKGTACLKNANYDCAIANAESALEFSPGYADAVKLKADAEKQEAEAYKKAKSMNIEFQSQQSK